MKRLCLALSCILLLVGCSSSRNRDRQAAKQQAKTAPPVTSVENSYRVASRFEAVAAFRNPTDGKTKLAYGTALGYVYIMNLGSNGPEPEWQSPYLGSPVRGLLVRDFLGKGQREILVYTVGGRMSVLDMRDYTTVRENAAFDLSQISYVIAEQVDDDPAMELLICGGGSFVVYDSSTLFKEWEATQAVPGEWMAVGDVDGDGQPEVVLNSGYILDGHFFRVKQQLGTLGRRVDLLDVDGDGVEEIIAEQDDGSINIYDARLSGAPEY